MGIVATVATADVLAIVTTAAVMAIVAIAATAQTLEVAQTGVYAPELFRVGVTLRRWP